MAELELRNLNRLGTDINQPGEGGGSGGGGAIAYHILYDENQDPFIPLENPFTVDDILTGKVIIYDMQHNDGEPDAYTVELFTFFQAEDDAVVFMQSNNFTFTWNAEANQYETATV